MMNHMEVYAAREIPAAVRRAVIARDGKVCRLCSRKVTQARGHGYRPDALHLDHIEHWAAGGQHAVENLRVVCADCNLRRPKATETLRQRKVRVEYRNGTHWWPDGYKPPLISRGKRHRLRSIKFIAEQLGVTPAQVVRMVDAGQLAAANTKSIRVEAPQWMVGLAVKPRRVAPKVPAKPIDPERLAYWDGLIKERRARERAAREAKRAV